MNNLRRLRCFMAAANGESFGQAADRMNIARPAFSRHISQLEEELGVELFERGGRSARLTRAGRIYARQIEEVLSKLDIANANIANFSTNRRKLVRIGLPEFAAPDEDILGSINTARASHSNIDYAIAPMHSMDQVRAIEGAEIDIGFIYNWPGSSEALETYTVAIDPYVLAVPENHPLAAQDSISIADIRNENFVSISPELAPGSFNKLMSACSERYFTPRISQFAPTPNGLYTLIAAGIGISFVVNRSRAPATVVKKPVRDLSLSVAVDLIWRRGETRSAVLTSVQTLIRSLEPAHLQAEPLRAMTR